MPNAKIMNIIFYYDESNQTPKAIIFYSDGDVLLVDYDAGLDACADYYRYLDYYNGESNSVEIQKDLFTNNTIRVISKQELLEKYKSVIPQNIYQAIESNRNIKEERKIEDVIHPYFVDKYMPSKTKNIESIKAELKIVDKVIAKKKEKDSKPTGFADQYADVITDEPIPKK